MTPRRQLVKRSLLRDEIRDVIQNAILSKELKPGDRIVETQLAADLGVSKVLVREATRELEAIGLLENKPFQGSYARIITAKGSVFNFRTALLLIHPKYVYCIHYEWFLILNEM